MRDYDVIIRDLEKLAHVKSCPYKSSNPFKHKRCGERDALLVGVAHDAAFTLRYYLGGWYEWDGYTKTKERLSFWIRFIEPVKHKYAKLYELLCEAHEKVVSYKGFLS